MEVAAAAEHVGTVIKLSSSVTAPLRARIRPLTVAPVFSVADDRVRMVPAKLVVVPSVADVPTCQNTLHACAPFSSTTELPEAVVSVDPIWKMKTASASPSPLRVTAPVRAMLVEDAYTPGVNVVPPRSAATVVNGVRPAASR